MGQVTERINSKLEQIKEIGGKPNFINAGPETERKLREELEDDNVMAGDGAVTGFSSPDEYPLIYRSLTVMEAHNEAADFLSVTYMSAQSKQLEL